MKELGELPPQWECLRCDVIKHCNHLIGSYQETLVELDRRSGEYGYIYKCYWISEKPLKRFKSFENE